MLWTLGIYSFIKKAAIAVGSIIVALIAMVVFLFYEWRKKK